MRIRLPQAATLSTLKISGGHTERVKQFAMIAQSRNRASEDQDLLVQVPAVRCCLAAYRIHYVCRTEPEIYIALCIAP